MIDLDLDTVAVATGGTAHGAATVTAPASLDSRAVEAGGLFVAIAGEHVDGHDYAEAAIAGGAAAVLGSRSLAVPHVLVPDATVALGLLARHVHDRLPDLVTIGVTGSAGKTSTKDLLAHLLESSGPTIAPVGSFNNELGVPLTVLRASATTRYLVVEMGARGLGHIAALCRTSPPDVGVVLNVGSAHAGEFGGLDVTAQAKGELVESLDPDGLAVLNADDARVAAMAERTAARVTTFGTTGDVRLVSVRADDEGRARIVLAHDREEVEVLLPLVGLHHGMNAAAAAAVGLGLGLDLPAVAARLESAVPRSPHRMARHVRDDGVVVVDDSYNANPESMVAALRSLVALRRPGGRIVAVLGEMRELGADSDALHRALGVEAAALGVDQVVVVGPEAAGIAEGAGDRAAAVPDVDVAVDTLHAGLGPRDVVLVKASRGARLERVADALVGATRHTSEGP